MSVATQAFRWNTNYSVNIIELDQQHQGLFDTVNQLNQALTSGQGHAVTDEILEKLVEYAGTHFASEETLMAKFNYPGYATHRAEHHAFAQRVSDFVSDYREGKSGVPVSLTLFLQSWLKGHILHSDEAYSAFLTKKMRGRKEFSRAELSGIQLAASRQLCHDVTFAGFAPASCPRQEVNKHAQNHPPVSDQAFAIRRRWICRAALAGRAAEQHARVPCRADRRRDQAE